MTRTQAVARIARGLGFRSGLDNVIVSALQEAQRDLEKGKTLPPFLLQEDETLTLPAGDSTVALPTGFLRIKDDERPHFTPDDTNTPFFLEQRGFDEALVAQIRTDDEPRAPSVYVLRRTVIDFINEADQEYTFTWSYYKKATLLDTDVENEWLDDDNNPEWLIGAAGLIVAKDLRDKTAVEIFSDMMTRARAAVFAEIVLNEDNRGARRVGASL